MKKLDKPCWKNYSDPASRAAFYELHKYFNGMVTERLPLLYDELKKLYSTHTIILQK